MAVDPSLMASREYSTWKRRPSGEKVLCNRSLGQLSSVRAEVGRQFVLMGRVRMRGGPLVEKVGLDILDTSI
jgi:hypothetical protein